MNGAEGVNLRDMSEAVALKEDSQMVEPERRLKPRHVDRSLGRLRVALNPVVTLLSAAVIWALVIWCIKFPDAAYSRFTPWKMWITETWSWLYVGTRNVGLVMLLGMLVSKYSKLKLGRDDEKPEFGDVSYFSMLFACGIGVGIFYFGIAEAIYHYEPGAYGNRYWARYTDNQRAQDAINLTFFHWGIHGWVCYNFTGLILAIVAYRLNLPMTIRSSLYPLLGDRVNGIIGDLVDSMSVVCTVFATSTSLGLGVMQLTRGLNRMSGAIPISTTTQIVVLWIVVSIAIASVVSGLKLGIKLLSQICIALGMFILFVVMLVDDTWYILNTFVQSTGYYLQTAIQMGFHTDAFAIEGNAADGKENPTWMNEWTIFYWAWWTAYAPSVGLFIAKISRGRTIGQYIKFTMTIPIIYVFFWMAVFSGAGLRMEREAAKANITCSSPLGGRNSTESLDGLYRLSCRSIEDMWFDVMMQYKGVGLILSVASIASIILYFVTTADSASLVTDSMASNGRTDTPAMQKVFWAVTQGACATALLVAGGKEALQAIQTISVVGGLPFTVVMVFMFLSLWYAMKYDDKVIRSREVSFRSDMFDAFETCGNAKKFVLAFFTPFYFFARAAGKKKKSHENVLIMLLGSALVASLILMLVGIYIDNFVYVGLTIYLFYACYCATIRMRVRDTHGIPGSALSDFFICIFMHPFGAFQMYETSRSELLRVVEVAQHADRTIV